MNQDIWTGKLLAFLHDPPCKPMDIPGHAERAAAYRQRAWSDRNPEDIHADKFFPVCDHTSAAADRFPFPVSRVLKSGFSGNSDTPFKHPMGGSELIFDKPIPSSGFAEEAFQATQPSLDNSSLPDDRKSWARFFLHWRRWPVEAARKDPRTAFLPADTRLPDHNVWIHDSVTSAMQACVDESKKLRPAFLLFQLGPVQEFIAQARSLRDLWSGSYMLSWLMAHAIKAITDRIGPDNIVFPSLREQPIFDYLHRKELYEKVRFNEETLWERLGFGSDAYLTPSLPNRFLALVPEWQAKELALAATDAIHMELKLIADTCWKWLHQRQPMRDEWFPRYEKQVELFPQVTWQILPWKSNVGEAIDKFRNMYAVKFKAATNLADLHKLAVETIDSANRDERYFIDKTEKRRLNNIGFVWPYFYAEADRLLAGRRNLRDFKQWEIDKDQAGTPKDFFSGKEEVIGDEEWWKALPENSDEALKSFFRKPDRLGAMNLIKRVWHKAYLVEQREMRDKQVQFDSVPAIAANKKTLTPEEEENFSGYIGILCLDGDGMGKWMSGENMPSFKEQLSKEALKYFKEVENAKSDNKYIAGLQRPLSPSWHMQFSEALCNYAQHIVRPIVEKHNGELIYAGGDDVLAILPVGDVLKCAQDLRAGFRGEAVTGLFAAAGTNGGFLQRIDGRDKRIRLVPGPKTNVSVGIAIGHCHSPLQGFIRAAREAEKSAKKQKPAVSISLFKRSGEKIKWTAQWVSVSPLLSLMEEFLAISGDALSKSFPYALLQTVTPYLGRLGADDEEKGLEDVPDFDWSGVLQLEVNRVIARQARETREEVAESFGSRINGWLAPKQQDRRNIESFVDMLRIGAFLARKEIRQ